jgi:DNA-binding GntR family transcriptional regulator
MTDGKDAVAVNIEGTADGNGKNKAPKGFRGQAVHEVMAFKTTRGKRGGKARDMTWTVYSSLRESILNGVIAPGASLSQVQLASELGVSRGPLREAIRMLQREGLVEAEVNRRGCVSSFSIEDLEQIYAMRIVHEALAVRISVPQFSKTELATLRGHLRRMDELADNDVKQWQVEDRELHFGLVAHVGDRMMRTIRELYDHADRYRSLYIKETPRALSIAAAEHKGIVDASADGDSVLASAELARHLARTALTVLTHHAPEHDPTTVRAAIRLATGMDGVGKPANGFRLISAPQLTSRLRV